MCWVVYFFTNSVLLSRSFTNSRFTLYLPITYIILDDKYLIILYRKIESFVSLNLWKVILSHHLASVNFVFYHISHCVLEKFFKKLTLETFGFNFLGIIQWKNYRAQKKVVSKKFLHAWNWTRRTNGLAPFSGREHMLTIGSSNK